MKGRKRNCLSRTPLGFAIVRYFRTYVQPNEAIHDMYLHQEQVYADPILSFEA